VLKERIKALEAENEALKSNQGHQESAEAMDLGKEEVEERQSQIDEYKVDSLPSLESLFRPMLGCVS
jgi:hypothetical protein